MTTKDREETILRIREAARRGLFEQGTKCVDRIAHEFGLHTSTIRKIINGTVEPDIGGFTCPDIRKFQVSGREKGRIWFLLNRGWSFHKIAKHLKRSPKTVRDVQKELGYIPGPKLKPKPKPKPGQKRGEDSPAAKLTDQDVLLIRAARETLHASLKTLAKYFRVDESTVSLIVNGKRRRTVKPETREVTDSDLRLLWEHHTLQERKKRARYMQYTVTEKMTIDTLSGK